MLFVGVSKAILEAAGQAVEDECQTLGKKMFMPFFNYILLLKKKAFRLNTKRQNIISLKTVL